MVSPATFRRPSVLARLVATADPISGGRIELGLGAGWSVREHKAHGFPYTTFATPEECRERRARIGKACEQARREPITFSLMTVCIVGRNPREVLDRARRRLELSGRDDDPIVLLGQEDKLVGTVEEVVARLKEHELAGVERVFLQHLDHADLDMVGLIGKELVPALA